MTAATVALGAAPTRERGGVTFGRVLASEWIKFRSVRATLWTLPLTLVAMVGVAVLSAWGMSTLESHEDFTAADAVTAGTQFGQLVVVVLAILTITGEYGTGQIRSSLTAVPRRTPVLAAKALVLAASVAAVTVLSIALSWVAALPFLGRMDMTLDLGSGQTLRQLLGCVLYLSTIALFALAVGALMRHTAGALAVVLGLLLVIENVVAALPVRFFEVVGPYLPASAGSRILSDDATLRAIDMTRDGTHLAAWQGYGVLALWVAVLGTAAVVLLRRRDA